MASLQEYLDVIAAYERTFDKWEKRAENIVGRYRDDKRKRDTETRVNYLWANVQTLVPACFSRVPQPDVSRRFRDNDPVGRVAALILERALDFAVQHYADYRTTMDQSVTDRFLGGRGTAWVRYEPIFKPLQVTEDAENEEPQEQLDYECCRADYVAWKDFGHEVARTWEEVTKVWRKVYMSEKAVIKRFGKEIAKKVPYDQAPEEQKRQNDKPVKKQACIYELWDKEEKQVIWLCKSLPEPIEVIADPLQLHDFFPCPRPLYATMTNETLVPVPDFTLYQDQANDLDILADRIDGLCRMLQVKGTYDGSETALSRLFTEGTNGTLVPVKNWAAFAEKSGLKGSIDVVDLTPIAQALKIAVEAFAQKKMEMDELSGVIDVMRGNVDPNEKLGQTEMKGATANLRLRKTQESVARYATEILQLMAQIMCSKFDPKTIAAMAAVTQLNPMDQPYIEQAMALLVGEERMQDPEADAPNPMLSFRIEIAADSLIQMNEQEEKQSRMELLTAVGQFLEKAAMAPPPMLPLLVELGKFGVTGFKVGKTIEGAFDQLLDQLKEQAAQPQPPQEPPEVQVERMKQEGEQAKLQAQMQAEQVKAQNQMQLEQAKLQQQMELERMKLEMQERLEMAKLQSQAAIAQAQQSSQEAIAQQQMMSDEAQAQAQMTQDAELAEQEHADNMALENQRLAGEQEMAAQAHKDDVALRKGEQKIKAQARKLK